MLEEGLAQNILDALEQPLDLALEIMEERAFAQAKHALDLAKDSSEVNHPMVDTVFKIVREAYGTRKPGSKGNQGDQEGSSASGG